VSRPFANKNLRFYLTSPAACPYLPGRRERKVFTALDGPDAVSMNDSLTHAGFRRSQNIAYRPACETCDSCISARVVADQFAPHRRWRKVIHRNADLDPRLTSGQATEEQFWLLRRYLLSRHGVGGMADMTLLDYAAMVEETSVQTHIVEYRYKSGPHAGELAACALTDILRDGLSLVYSFFDTGDERRSMGAFVILDHILRAQRAGLPHVYLGYWVPGSQKMAYKAQFRPLEILRAGAWRPIETVFPDA
jgi:arginyl-tRNA--protein-N-Asp/Glu arginylyltransferase